MIMNIQLPPLPYALNALAPMISEETLKHHYLKHHRKYVTTLNQLIENTPYESMNLEEIMSEAFRKGGRDQKIFNNAAQVWNHTFYWSCMTPEKSDCSEPLEQALKSAFGSTDAFLEQFKNAGKNLFGSGYVWLVKNEKGELLIRALPNANNPLMDGEVPLLTCDVWEHAYYLDVQEERDRYLEGFKKLIHWQFVSKNYDDSALKLSHMNPSRLKADSPQIHH